MAYLEHFLAIYALAWGMRLPVLAVLLKWRSMDSKGLRVTSLTVKMDHSVANNSCMLCIISQEEPIGKACMNPCGVVDLDGSNL